MAKAALDPANAGTGSLGVVKLVALGVSLAVAGSFTPWGFGIGIAGWGGMLLAFALVGVFYVCLLWCLAELASRISEPGGGQAFAARAFGPFGRVLAGGAGSVEFLCSTGALGALTSIYIEALTGISPSISVPVLFSMVVLIHLRGVGEAIGVTLFLSVLTVLGVLTFVGVQAAAPAPSSLSGIVGPVDLGSVWLALPFAVTFFLGIEGVPLAAADAANPRRDIPRAMLIALAIIAALGLAVMTAGPMGAGVDAVTGTADTMMAAIGAPAVAAPQIARVVVNVAGLAGLCASFFGIVYALSRQVHALALTGDLPRLLLKVNRHNAPFAALVGPALVGALLALFVSLDELIVITVAAALIFYLVTIASFVSLRREWTRESHSLLSQSAVVVGAILGLVIFSACVASDIPVLVGVSAALLVLALYRVRKSATVPRPEGSP